MKNQNGITLITILLVIVLIFAGILAFKFIFNNNTETNNNSSISTNINTKNNNSKIVGSWKIDIIGSSKVDDKSYSMYIFNEDGTGSASSYGINMDFIYTINADIISVIYKSGIGGFENKYSIKDDKLYLGDDIICTKVQ